MIVKSAAFMEKHLFYKMSVGECVIFYLLFYMGTLFKYNCFILFCSKLLKSCIKYQNFVKLETNGSFEKYLFGKGLKKTALIFSRLKEVCICPL